MKCCNSLFVQIVGDIYVMLQFLHLLKEAYFWLMFRQSLEQLFKWFGDKRVKEMHWQIPKYDRGHEIWRKFSELQRLKSCHFFNGWRILKFAWQVMINIKRERVRALWEIDVCQKLNVAKHFLLTKRFHSYHE